MRWQRARVLAISAAMSAAICAAMAVADSSTAFAQEAQGEAGSQPPVQGGLAIDWTTGPAFGDVPTLGGVHGLGIEGRVAAFGALELDGRYEMLGIALPMDMGNGYSHQLLGQVKLRWVTDATRRQLWAIGGGYGLAFRPDSLGGRTTIGRVSLTRQIGWPKSVADVAAEISYERSFSDMRLDMVLGSFRFGLTSGPEAHYLGPKSPIFPRTTSFDMFAPGGAGMTMGLHAGPLSLETSANYMARAVIGTDSAYHGFRGAQWAVQTGIRYQHPTWPLPEAPGYAQVQAGVAWIARDPGELRPVQTAEVGVRLVCSDWGVEGGVWVRTDVEDGGLHLLLGGLAVRIVLSTDRIIIGGRNRKCAEETSGGYSNNTRTVSTGSSSTSTSTSTDISVSAGIDAIQQALHPPTARVETVQPRAGFVWIAGHWQWSGSAWTWVGGHWEAERAGMRWIPGTYEVRGNVSVYVEGHWAN